MTLIDDLCDGCGGRFDPMGDPLLTRHPEVGPWAVYCATCERRTTADNLRQRLTTALAWMGPDHRQAVEDVLAVLEEDA